MKPSLIRVAALLISCLLLPAAHAADDVRIDYREGLQQLEIQVVGANGLLDHAVQQKPGRQQLVEAMRFNAFGRQFDMHLAPNHGVMNAATRAQLADNIEVYRGEIAGAPDSWVRITFVSGVPVGMFSDGDTMYAIETDAAAPDSPFVFRLDDLHLEPGAFSCQSSGVHNPKNAGELFRAVSRDMQASAAQGPGATSNLDIDVVADQIFTNVKTDAQASMITRMNNIDGIFSSQVGVQLTINRSDAFTSADDPFTDELDSGDLLDEVGNFRLGVPSNERGGLTHLFTGRNVTSTDPDTGEVSTGNVGVAYRGALCSSRFGVGLTEARFTVTTDSLIAAHEIGHNFGAPHDGTDGSACESETGTFLMAPSVNGSDQFSSCSIEQMNIEIASVSCITPLASQDISVSGSPAEQVLLGQSSLVTFDVSNVGAATATDIDVDVVIPSNVTVDSATANIGSCSSGGGGVNCTISSLAAGSGSVISINATATGLGTANFTAVGTVSGDANTNNNDAVVNNFVIPAIDLAVSAPAVEVVVGNIVTASVTTENRGPSPATGASFTITPGSGLSVLSATWTDGSCAVSAGVATCSLGSYAASSVGTISVRMTGDTVGNQTYAIASTAGETDTATGNNSATGQVTVTSTAPPPSSNIDSGGSGALDWFALLLLSALCLSRLTRLSQFGACQIRASSNAIAARPVKKTQCIATL